MLKRKEVHSNSDLESRRNFDDLSARIEEGENLRSGRFVILILLPAKHCCLWNYV